MCEYVLHSLSGDVYKEILYSPGILGFFKFYI